MAKTGEKTYTDELYAEFERRKEKLLSRLGSALRRQQGKLKKLSAALKETENAGMFQRCGELLKANLKKLRRGWGKVKVTDYYSEGQPEITIELAKEKTPLENMKAYFKRAKKLRHGRPKIEREMALAGQEITRLEGLSVSLANISNPQAFEDAAVEVEAALAPKRPKKLKGRPQGRLGPRRFVSSDGYEILVGRNQRQNDRLTLTIASGRDLFMHASGSPGSHIIIRLSPKGDPPRRTMLEAANLAVYYSKSRNRRHGEVSWTHVKNVSKPRGAKPGLVYLAKHRVLSIELDRELVKMLRENAKEL